jgi:succinate dehydrogenase / fumarate reductase cytochrome b subunit
MGILGTLILVFLVVHIRHFYAEVHFFGGVDTVMYGDEKIHNLYATVALWFSKGWYVG